VVASQSREITRNSHKNLTLEQFKVIDHGVIVTLGVSATVFEILTLKAGKSLNFLIHPSLRLPFGGNPLEFGDEISRQ